MHGLAPCGKRGNAAIYDVAEVAARCGKLTAEQIDAAMKRLNHADLPKELTKEYWNGLRAKQAYLKDEGDLWPTDKVIEAVGEFFKLVKMSTMLCADAVERQVELTDRQRAIIQAQMDGMLLDLHNRIITKFQEERRDVSDVLAETQDDDDDL
jgi:hypothetical protein